LSNSTVYTVTVHGGAADPRIKNTAGTALAADVVWSFTTAAPTGGATCPCSIWSTAATPVMQQQFESSAGELGVKFQSDRAGYITGLRFYKGAGNNGTHVGSIWSSSGTLLGSVTFANETVTGWQQADFTTPIAVVANTAYVASYYSPVGRYVADA